AACAANSSVASMVDSAPRDDVGEEADSGRRNAGRRSGVRARWAAGRRPPAAQTFCGTDAGAVDGGGPGAGPGGESSAARRRNRPGRHVVNSAITTIRV